MTLRQVCLLSTICLSIVALVQPVFATDTSGATDELMSGYVKDGLHCEANVNFLGAIQAYTNATNDDPKDRCAWVHLAKIYRANEQFYKSWLAGEESRQKQQTADHRLLDSIPVIAFEPEYLPHSNIRRDSSEFGHFRTVEKPHQPNRIERILHEDQYIYGKVGEPSLMSMLCESYFRESIYPVSLAEVEARVERERERARKVYQAELAKDLAWKNLEESHRDDAAAWLTLGVASADCRARESEAALRVVLLSNPNQEQAEQARLALSKYWAHSPII